MESAPDQRQIHICLCINVSYAPHAAVLMASVLRHTNGSATCFHLLHDGVERARIAEIDAMLAAANACSAWYEVSDLKAPPEATAHGWSASASYRLLIPELLPQSVQRVLYLDSDMVVLDDITELWGIDLEGRALGAVREIPSEEDARMRLERFGPGHVYFNSGVLLLDLNTWRRERLAARVWAAMAAGKGEYRYPDQDALNAVFDGRWKRLPDRWNMQRLFTKVRASELGVSLGEYARMALRPGIIHFTGNPKPWRGKQRHPFNWAYWRAARATPLYPEIVGDSGGAGGRAFGRAFAYVRYLGRLPFRALT